jgi:hypothetical protein
MTPKQLFLWGAGKVELAHTKFHLVKKATRVFWNKERTPKPFLSYP